MLQKLYALSSYLSDELIDENDYDLDMSERKEKVIVLDFQLDHQHCELKEVFVEEYSREKNLTKFYYKGAKANTKSEFPSIIISDKDLKIDDNYARDSKSYKKLKTILKNCSEKEKSLSPLTEYFESRAEDILLKISEKLISKDTYILTLKINEAYIGESHYFDSIREKTRNELLSPYYTNSKEIRKQNKSCSLCLEKEKEVWGYVSTFNFYAVKTEYPPIAGGFDQNSTWKNYPVCPDCAVKLKRSKSALTKYMRYSLYGISYFILPSFILDDKEKNTEIMNLFFQKEHLGRFHIDPQNRKKISADENEILDLLAQSDNQLCYNLFFFEENNSEFKILMSMDEVFPSQLKAVFQAKKKVERHTVFHEIPGLLGKNTVADLEFRLDLLKEFFPINSKIYGDFKKSFLEITRSIFLQKEVSFSFILQQIMKHITHKFANNEGIYYTTLKSFMLLKFLKYLGMIPSANINQKEVAVEALYQNFFDEHSDFFDTNIKKAIFLEGVLCQHLLDVQYQNRKATPFRSHLNGMKLNPKLIQKLLPEMIEKFDQYDSRYYRKLETSIAELFIDSDFNLSNDEISYYFVLGMSLNKQLINSKEKENDNQ